ncbi:hypothetical protein B9T29_03225 [Acinetobacter sp. ANC 3903]|uniref:stealth family protein n=1 Tax=Acinetobacter sp. ANC 3903 TaxID=1977883 RepID=UPI000A35592B|nr:stealth family protein [Acinetobacter sp. ANC 3903]OTG63733.1 hypothetical protein B9T29_03225 [Acinetobacter sp. ANC 3903]
MSDIDFVVTWVDGNDPEWQEHYRFYKGQYKNISPHAVNISRFRDWDNFHFWFRSVEKYCPWVRKVHLVTSGHYPVWLNINHPKLNLVKHEDIIPRDFLPTFNSQVIGIYLNKINNLSENFVYFNDDVFVNKDISPDYFFKRGVPCDQLLMESLFQIGNKHSWAIVRHRCVNIINEYFNKKEVMYRHFSKIFNIHYGLMDNLKNLFQFPYGYFSAFHDYHVSAPMLRSTFDKIWNKEMLFLTDMSSHRFRSEGEVNTYLFRYWNLVEGNFYPVNKSRRGRCYNINSHNIDEIVEMLLREDACEICINDHESVDDFVTLKMKLTTALLEKFPRKSSFELDMM